VPAVALKDEPEVMAEELTDLFVKLPVHNLNLWREISSFLYVLSQSSEVASP
jgi:hypothetical protein